MRVAATCDEDGHIVTPERDVPYDTLVVAVGSVTNDFHTPGVQEYAIPLETAYQAERFNRRLVNAFLRAQTQTEPIRLGQLHIAIVGAGATGTELAAELYRTARQVIAFNLDRINPDTDIRIVLVDAGARILSALSGRIASAATALLVKLGFGSLVTLGQYRTIGNLMGFLIGPNFWVEGFIARLMYRSLYKMHEYAISGGRRLLFQALGRSLSRRSEPQVKLHQARHRAAYSARPRRAPLPPGCTGAGIPATSGFSHRRSGGTDRRHRC